MIGAKGIDGVDEPEGALDLGHVGRQLLALDGHGEIHRGLSDALRGPQAALGEKVADAASEGDRLDGP